MDLISRRQVFAMGAGVALLANPLRADAGDKKKVIVANEEAILFKVRDVTLDEIEQTKRTIKVIFGKADAPIKLTGLPLSTDIKIRVSFVEPGTANNLPFEWERLKGLVGKKISMMLRAEASAITVDSIATAND